MDSYHYGNAPDGFTVSRVKSGSGHRYVVEWSSGNKSAPMPSVTTLINRVIPKPGLVGWMRNRMDEEYRKAIDGYMRIHGPQNMNEAVIEEVSAAALAATARTDARDDGTELHAAIEASIMGKLVDEKWSREVALFEAWMVENGLIVVESEVPVVDLGLAVGGTFDILARTTYGDQKYVLIDLKRAKGIYQEHWLQLGAYAEMIHMRFDEDVATGIILQFTENDDGPALTAHHVKDISDARVAWRELATYTMAFPPANSNILFTVIGG